MWYQHVIALSYVVGWANYCVVGWANYYVVGWANKTLCFTSKLLHYNKNEANILLEGHNTNPIT